MAAAAGATVGVILLGVLMGGLMTVRHIAAGFGVAVLLAAGSIAVVGLLRTGVGATSNDPVAERLALEARRAELTTHATMPGSPLACLGALASEPVQSACEQTLFANATSVAVAVTYAAAQLRLLGDGIAFARQADPAYAASLADLRLAAENDAFGIYAHVLATRDGCTPERCESFALMHDPSNLKIHLGQRLYATFVARHRERWGLPAPVATPAPVTARPAASAPVLASVIGPGAAGAMESPISTTADMFTSAALAPMPLPKARPTTVVAARSEPETPAVPDPAEPRPAAREAEQSPAANEAPPATPHGIVPPVASVLPNLDFPSSSSIPPVSIMAAEPKLPPEAAPAVPPAPSTAPARPAPQR